MRRADGLALIAESFLHKGPKNVSPADRYQVVVHVDAETLRDGTAGRLRNRAWSFAVSGDCAAPGLRRELITVTENEQGEPLNVGRKTRSILRDTPCAEEPRPRLPIPGCTHQRYVDAHHVRHWVHGGETKLGNLVTLC